MPCLQGAVLAFHLALARRPSNCSLALSPTFSARACSTVVRLLVSRASILNFDQVVLSISTVSWLTSWPRERLQEILNNLTVTSALQWVACLSSWFTRS